MLATNFSLFSVPGCRRSKLARRSNPNHRLLLGGVDDRVHHILLCLAERAQ